MYDTLGVNSSELQVIIQNMEDPEKIGRKPAIVWGTPGQLAIYRYCKFAIQHSPDENFKYLGDMRFREVVAMSTALDAMRGRMSNEFIN